MPVETFNLSAPPGFRGLHPELPIRVYHRHLPHWRQQGATYFVTFRLADSIPQEQLRSLKRWREHWEQTHQEPRSEAEWRELAREITKRTEAYLDEGYGECIFKEKCLAEEMSQSLRHFQDVRYQTSCVVVMPNHIHLVIRPFNGFELQELLQSSKGFVARKVNSHLKRKGQLWEEESYDRIIRDEEHLLRVIQYIGRNPEKAGLSAEDCCLWLHPEWAAAGYRFQ